MNAELLELIKKYAEMFKIALIIAGAALLISLFLLIKIVPNMTTFFGNQKNYTTTKEKLDSKKKELLAAKRNKEKQEAMEQKGLDIKAFYKNPNATSDTTADILAGEIQEINDLIKYYNIKMYKVNYVYDPADDIFYKEKKATYSVCKVNMELFASYMKFQSFLKDLYKHEHFLDIQTIEINPYKKDKSILHIKMDLNLYAEKDKNAGANREVPATPSKASSVESEDLNLEIEI